MRSITAISPEKQSRPWERGIASLMDPACRDSGGCGGGPDRTGLSAPRTLCRDASDADASFGSGLRTAIAPNAYLYGAGYSLGSTPSGTQGAVQTFAAGGVAFGFSRGPSDVFTEGEGAAGHPAKWGYRPLPLCKNTADLQKYGAGGAAAGTTSIPLLYIVIAIIFLLVVLK